MLTGGHLSDIPEPHKRKFPGDKKRRVSVRIGRYDLVGGVHYHVTLSEEENPVWNRLTNADKHQGFEGTPYGKKIVGWQLAWDDDSGNGREFHATVNRIFQIADFVKATWEKHFSNETHYLTTNMEIKPMTIEELEADWRQSYAPMQGKYYYQKEGD